MLTRGRQQQIEEQRTLTLLKLPALVINEILDYILDPRDLGALRATCKSTKAWIDDQPDQLVKFPVVIKGKKGLDQVVRSSRFVRWNNLVFTQTHYGTKGGKGSIGDLLQRCGPWLKSLTVGVKRDKYKDGRHFYVADSVTTEELIVNFLIHLDSSSAPQLESLRLEGEFLLPTLSLGNSENDKRVSKDRAKLLEGLEGRLPQVRRFEFIPRSPQWRILTWPLVQLFLNVFPNLTWIRIAALAAASPIMLPFVPEMENPFMDYLQALVNKPPAQRPTQFSLDFCSDRDLVVDSSEDRVTEFDKVFKFGVTELIQLAKLAVQIGGKFWNVPLGAMVPFGEERRLGEQVQEALRATLGSVLCKNVTSGIGQGQYYFPDPNTPIFVHLDLDTGNDYANFDLPEDTNVQSISVFDVDNDPDVPLCWRDVTGGEILQEKLFKVVRPSVRTLRLGNVVPICHSRGHADLGDEDDDDEDDDDPAPAPESSLTTLLAHLPSTLEELSLANCTINPEWFFTTTSPENPQFILKKLKHLTKVSIVSCKLIDGEHGSDSEDEDEGAEPSSDMKDKLYDGLEALGLKEFVFINDTTS